MTAFLAYPLCIMVSGCGHGGLHSAFLPFLPPVLPVFLFTVVLPLFPVVCGTARVSVVGRRTMLYTVQLMFLLPAVQVLFLLPDVLHVFSVACTPQLLYNTIRKAANGDAVTWHAVPVSVRGSGHVEDFTDS